MERRPGVHNASETGEKPMKFLIAVDFGTTFSGVAYTLVNAGETQKESLVTDWGEGLTGDKVPSILRYEHGATVNSVSWGFEADRRRKPGEKIHEWFKLGLCPEIEHSLALGSDLLRRYPSKTALPPLDPDQCKKLVIRYLQGVKSAIDRLFEQRVGEFYNLPREYIITVPAMWSHGAQEAMRECAAEAFLGDPSEKEELSMIAEPEAAGIYALSEMFDIGLEAGDTFVICDAGGGTVDLSSYEILSKDSYIALKRVAGTPGELCGSCFINRIFEDYLMRRSQLQHIDWDSKNGLQLLKSAVGDFERGIKPQFTGLNTGSALYLNTPFPSAGPRGAEFTLIEIPVDELRKQVFDPVVSKICRLVRHQVDSTIRPTRKVKKVLLAGGFGQNAYLKREIEKTVGETIKVQKIDNSRTAIVRGALMAGLAKIDNPQRHAAWQDGDKRNEQGRGRIFERNVPRVMVREAPCHYGTRVFRHEKSNASAQQNGTNPNTGRSRPREFEVMRWFVNKGDEIYDGEPKHFELQYKANIALGEHPPKIICDVYSSKADTPPPRPHTSRHPVPGLEKPLATVCMDLDTIPEESLHCRVFRGRKYYDVAFDVYMTLNSAELTFVLGRGAERYKPAKVTVNETEWGL
ncbi:hypothetical protein MANI_027234 [Metarhizium anisopliae]